MAGKTNLEDIMKQEEKLATAFKESNTEVIQAIVSDISGVIKSVYEGTSTDKKELRTFVDLQSSNKLISGAILSAYYSVVGKQRNKDNSKYFGLGLVSDNKEQLQKIDYFSNQYNHAIINGKNINERKTWLKKNLKKLKSYEKKENTEQIISTLNTMFKEAKEVYGFENVELKNFHYKGDNATTRRLVNALKSKDAHSYVRAMMDEKNKSLAEKKLAYASALEELFDNAGSFDNILDIYSDLVKKYSLKENGFERQFKDVKKNILSVINEVEIIKQKYDFTRLTNNDVLNILEEIFDAEFMVQASDYLKFAEIKPFGMTFAVYIPKSDLQELHLKRNPGSSNKISGFASARGRIPLFFVDNNLILQENQDLSNATYKNPRDIPKRKLSSAMKINQHEYKHVIDAIINDSFEKYFGSFFMKELSADLYAMDSVKEAVKRDISKNEEHYNEEINRINNKISKLKELNVPKKLLDNEYRNLVDVQNSYNPFKDYITHDIDLRLVLDLSERTKFVPSLMKDMRNLLVHRGMSMTKLSYLIAITPMAELENTLGAINRY